ncbi:MAG: hypothetical protein FWF13_04075 [Acidobacteria bacterium]|nr:hypothetical protein [Acidobacteriota bacterium]
MNNCKNCIHWIDESLADIETNRDGKPHIFMGCKIHGPIEKIENRRNCPEFVMSGDLYAICDICKIIVPRVCISMGECINCTDTDLYCVESCIGGDARKYCTHFVRLNSEGIQLIDEERKEVFDLFPDIGMPDAKK